jgi:hypothetical protein
MHHVFAGISIEEPLRRADAADRHGQEELHQDRGCCGRYIPRRQSARSPTPPPRRDGSARCGVLSRGGEVSCMIGGYQAAQISLDDLASGFRNRTWAAITRDWAAKLGRPAVRQTTLSQ